MSIIDITKISFSLRGNIYRCCWESILCCPRSVVEVLWPWGRCLECRSNHLYHIEWSPTILGWWGYFLYECSIFIPNSCMLNWILWFANQNLMFFPLCYTETEQGIFEQVLGGELDFSSDPWPSISESAKDLVRRMLVRDPKKRLTAHEALCKSFF